MGVTARGGGLAGATWIGCALLALPQIKGKLIKATQLSYVPAAQTHTVTHTQTHTHTHSQRHSLTHTHTPM